MLKFDRNLLALLKIKNGSLAHPAPVYAFAPQTCYFMGFSIDTPIGELKLSTKFNIIYFCNRGENKKILL